MVKSINAWIGAMRLRTLPLSLSGIIVGSALAYFFGAWDVLVFSMAISTTIFFQINRWKNNGQTPEEAYDSLELHGEEKPPRDEFISKTNSLFSS